MQLYQVFLQFELTHKDSAVETKLSVPIGMKNVQKLPLGHYLKFNILALLLLLHARTCGGCRIESKYPRLVKLTRHPVIGASINITGCKSNADYVGISVTFFGPELLLAGQKCVM